MFTKHENDEGLLRGGMKIFIPNAICHKRLVQIGFIFDFDS
jgi:hypothetical protein